MKGSLCLMHARRNLKIQLIQSGQPGPAMCACVCYGSDFSVVKISD